MWERKLKADHPWLRLKSSVEIGPASVTWQKYLSQKNIWWCDQSNYNWSVISAETGTVESRVWQWVLCDMSLTLPAAPLSTRATSFIQCQWSRTELCCSLMSGDSMMKNNLLWGETELYDWLTPTLTIDAGALNPVNSMIQSNNRDFKYHICRQELFWRLQHIFFSSALAYIK